MVRGPERRGLLVSRGWIQASVLVLLFRFFVLGMVAYRTYSGQPPIPVRVVGPGGEVVFTGDEVREGQKVFLRNGLMQYGCSIFGHGGNLGPDYTSDYLRRSALAVRESYGGGLRTGRRRGPWRTSKRTATIPRTGRSSTPGRKPRLSGRPASTTGGSSPSLPPGTDCAPRRSRTHKR